MSELKSKLENLLIEGGKYVSITKENESPIVVNCWFKKNEDNMIMYYNGNSGISSVIPLTDIKDIRKKAYKEYEVSYLNGSRIVLKFRSKLIG